jgi:hypothetical protein
MSALGRFRAALRKGRSPLFASPAPAAEPEGPAGSPFGRLPEGTCPGCSCVSATVREDERRSARPAVFGIEVAPFPSAAARVRAALPSSSPGAAPGGSRPVRVRIGRTFDTAVSVRVSIVPPGFCRGCRARLGRGFHLAAAVAAASSAALALHDPLPKARPAPAVPWNFPFRFRIGRPWPHREAVTFPESGEEPRACGLRG